MKTRIEVRALSSLQANLFVREALDQDRVLYFGMLIEAGVKIKPMMVNKRV